MLYSDYIFRTCTLIHLKNTNRFIRCKFYKFLGGICYSQANSNHLTKWYRKQQYVFLYWLSYYQNVSNPYQKIQIINFSLSLIKKCLSWKKAKISVQIFFKCIFVKCFNSKNFAKMEKHTYIFDTTLSCDSNISFNKLSHLEVCAYSSE